MNDCLSENDLERYHTGEMGAEARARAESHLEACQSCAKRNREMVQAHEDLIRHLRGVDLLVTKASDPKPGARPPAEAKPSSIDVTLNGSTLPPPTIAVEGYEIIRELGRGGMGFVYEAVQLKLNRKVALKVLLGMPGSTNRDAVARFRHEATAAAKLHHTHIVPIYDFGESGHTYYYAMELVDGRSLREMIQRFADINAPAASQTALAELLGHSVAPERGRTDSASGTGAPAVSEGSRLGSDSTGRGRVYFRQIAQWMADAADALHYANSQGIIHRDIKPGNLMLSRDGRIMILDFGLAKTAGDLSITATGSLLGTLRYMSPEQAMAKRMNVDHRTDIYSLGATMYELLTFQPAFAGRDEKETLGQIITKEPTPPRKIVPSVPRELETICLKTLEKDANARYATAKDLADDLRRYARDLPIVARPVGPVGRVVKFVRRRRAVSLAICATVFLVIAVTFAVRYARRAGEERKERMAATVRAREERLENLVTEGVLSMENRNFAAAEKAFTRVLQEDPEHYRALGNFALLRRYQYDRQHDGVLLDQATELLGRALKIKPESEQLWNFQGVFLRMRGRFGEAIEAHKKAIELNKTFYANWVSLASAHAMNGDTLEAEACLLKAIGLPGGADVVMAWHNLLAVQLHLAKSQALDTVMKLPKNANSNPASILLKAKLYLQLPGHTDPQKALRSATAADELAGPNHKNAHVKRILALAELRSEHWPEAVAAANKALDLRDDPAYPRLVLAVAEAHQGHLAAARDHLDVAVTSWPAELEAAGTVVTARGGFLWFETAAELMQLRAEAETAIAAQMPQP